jgi:hypothetical protein
VYATSRRHRRVHLPSLQTALVSTDAPEARARSLDWGPSELHVGAWQLLAGAVCLHTALCTSQVTWRQVALRFLSNQMGRTGKTTQQRRLFATTKQPWRSLKGQTEGAVRWPGGEQCTARCSCLLSLPTRRRPRTSGAHAAATYRVILASFPQSNRLLAQIN